MVEDLLRTDGAGAVVETLRDDAGVPTIRIAGEVDMSNADLIRSSLDLVANDPQRVVFDLGELRFMDSSGLAILLGVAERSAVVELRRPLPLVRRIIELTGLSGTFVITG